MLKQDVVPVKSNEVHPSPAVQGTLPATPNVQQHPVRYVHKSYYSEAGYQEKSDSSEWDAVLETMAAEIKVRHYSRKTLKTYANWSRQFQRYLKNKPPQELSTADVKDYLTHLVVKCKVASTTQNQAFNSLLFLYRHGLKREFGIKAVGELHDRDLAAGYDGVFLDDAVEKKYPKAPKEFVHQWFFPRRIQV